MSTAIKTTTHLGASATDDVLALLDEDPLDVWRRSSADFDPEGRLQDALTVLQAQVTREPEHSLAWRRMGLIFLRVSRPGEAEAALAQARRLGDESFECHLALGQALVELGRREEAVAELRVAATLNPTSHDVRYRLAVCLDFVGRYADATDALAEAIRLAPGEAVYHQSLGFTWLRMGKHDEAASCFRRAADLDRTRGDMPPELHR